MYSFPRGSYAFASTRFLFRLRYFKKALQDTETANIPNDLKANLELFV
jgi:hypothetical protein